MSHRVGARLLDARSARGSRSAFLRGSTDLLCLVQQPPGSSSYRFVSRIQILSVFTCQSLYNLNRLVLFGPGNGVSIRTYCRWGSAWDLWRGRAGANTTGITCCSSCGSRAIVKFWRSSYIIYQHRFQLHMCLSPTYRWWSTAG